MLAYTYHSNQEVNFDYFLKFYHVNKHQLHEQIKESLENYE